MWRGARENRKRNIRPLNQTALRAVEERIETPGARITADIDRNGGNYPLLGGITESNGSDRDKPGE